MSRPKVGETGELGELTISGKLIWEAVRLVRVLEPDRHLDPDEKRFEVIYLAEERIAKREGYAPEKYGRTIRPDNWRQTLADTFVDEA